MDQSCDRCGPAAERSFKLGCAQMAMRPAGLRALGGVRDSARRAGVALLAAVAMLVAAPAAVADTLHVPTVYPTIQSAIEAASDGDEVVVAPGTYSGGTQIIFRGKAITVRSSSGNPADTILDGAGWNFTHVVYCTGGEGRDTVLSGFTITGGNAHDSYHHYGGGMLIGDNSPTVTNCVFTGNSSDNGGGIAVFTGSPLITNCAFIGNSAFGFTPNAGGGIFVDGGAPTIVNCTFVGNDAQWSGGGIAVYNGSATVINSIFWANGAQGEIVGTAYVTYSNVQGGYVGEGNINADPLFVDAAGGDYRLACGSPCIDAGDNAAVPLDVADLDGDGDTTEATPLDLDGSARFLDDPSRGDTGRAGNGYPDAVVDMGTYERLHLPTIINVPANYATIQQAIDAAGCGNEILVAPGTYNEAINFIGKAITLRSVSGNPADTIINGNGATHVVQCVSGEEPGTVLSGFTITGGNAPGGYGAGMLNIGSSPTVTDCVFSGNTAQYGGGMYNEGGSPAVTNCDFDANSAVDGGGMYNLGGAPKVTGCTFSGNSTNQWGGGMYNNSANPTVTGCDLNGNSAGLWGGGMYSVGGTPTVTNCAFEGNSATLGGGMGNYLATPVVTNCLFTENTATEHGAGMGNLAANPSVTNCTFSENSAAVGGGGMFNSFGSSPAVSNCVFWGDGPNEIINDGSAPSITNSNVQGGYPGAGNIDADPLFVDAASGDYRLLSASPCIDAGDNTAVPADLADLDGDGDTGEATPRDAGWEDRFVDWLATPDTGVPGNGYPAAVVDMGAYEFNDFIYVPRDQPTIQAGIDAAVDGQHVVVAPGVYDAGFFGIRFNGKAITVRSASANPADTIISGETWSKRVVLFLNFEGPGSVLSGFTITGGVAGGANDQWDNNGGGMYNYYSSPTVSNCVFSGNDALRGGGMYNHHSSPTVTGCVFIRNIAVEGGGMYNFESSPTLTDCVFTGHSISGNGGGMYSWASGYGARLINCVFEENSVGGNGGGIYNAGYGVRTVTNCTFRRNTAGQAGGGVYNLRADITLSNCALIENTAGTRGGGLANIFSGIYNLKNSVLVGNTASDSGGGLFSSDYALPRVANSVLWGNTPNAIANINTGINITYSDVQGGYAGTGNIDADPLFVDAGGGDFHLSPGSPCIDAGDNTAVPAGVTTDLDGNPRFVDDPATPDTGVPGNGYPDDVVDMGAYEAPPGKVTCLADLDDNGLLDLTDINMFVMGFLGNDPVSDLDRNGLFDLADITAFLDAFVAGCP